MGTRRKENTKVKHSLLINYQKSIKVKQLSTLTKIKNITSSPKENLKMDLLVLLEKVKKLSKYRKQNSGIELQD